MSQIIIDDQEYIVEFQHGLCAVPSSVKNYDPNRYRGRARRASKPRRKLSMCFAEDGARLTDFTEVFVRVGGLNTHREDKRIIASARIERCVYDTPNRVLARHFALEKAVRQMPEAMRTQIIEGAGLRRVKSLQPKPPFTPSPELVEYLKRTGRWVEKEVAK